MISRTAVLVLALGVASGCGGGSQDPLTTIPSPLVDGDAGDYRVTVATGEGTFEVDDDAVALAVPLLVARVFDAAEPLEDYGLDDPTATVRFEPLDGGVPVELAVGDENFDGSGYYVSRSGDDRVFLVLDDQLDPLLDPRA